MSTYETWEAHKSCKTLVNGIETLILLDPNSVFSNITRLSKIRDLLKEKILSPADFNAVIESIIGLFSHYHYGADELDHCKNLYGLTRIVPDAGKHLQKLLHYNYDCVGLLRVKKPYLDVYRRNGQNERTVFVLDIKYPSYIENEPLPLLVGYKELFIVVETELRKYFPTFVSLLPHLFDEYRKQYEHMEENSLAHFIWYINSYTSTSSFSYSDFMQYRKHLLALSLAYGFLGKDQIVLVETQPPHLVVNSLNLCEMTYHLRIPYEFKYIGE